MLVISRHVEEKLLAFCTKLKESPVAWRAVYFFEGTSADYEKRQEVRLQLIVNIVKKYADGENTRVFVCEAGDVAVLTTGTAREVLDKICQEMENVFPDENGQRNAAMVMDLSIDFDKFHLMCEQKCLAAHEREVARQKKGDVDVVRTVQVDEAYAREILKKRPLRRNLHIQLVEDDLFTLQLVGNVLSGHTLIKSMDGVDAVESYMLNAPDIVFLDINLPGMNGHEVLERILAFDPSAYVVMLSGNSFMEDVARAVRTGAKGFVTKPFPKEKLLNYVNIYQVERKVS